MIETPRLLVRSWRDEDRAPFAAMCADPLVMEHLGPLLGRTEADAQIDRQIATEKAEGYCFWAVERRGDGAFLGFCGIKPGAEGTPIASRPEIGWRLAFPHWGWGYAREAAEACLAWAWAERPWVRVHAITTRGNIRSWGLMERLGMFRDEAADFDHPALPDGNPLKPHITYVANRPETA